MLDDHTLLMGLYHILSITYNKQQLFCRGVFCAGNPNDVQGACHGDSGGPLVKFEENIVEEGEMPYFKQIGNEISIK